MYGCFTLPEHLRSSPVFNEVHVVLSLVFCVMFCRLLFVLFLVAIALSVWFMASNYPLVFLNISYTCLSMEWSNHFMSVLHMPTQSLPVFCVTFHPRLEKNHWQLITFELLNYWIINKLTINCYKNFAELHFFSPINYLPVAVIYKSFRTELSIRIDWSLMHGKLSYIVIFPLNTRLTVCLSMEWSNHFNECSTDVLHVVWYGMVWWFLWAFYSCVYM